ncbi:hypothetical protein [Alteraurantiacibacter aestuarii]|uniref:Uncharacterized protein n=1 Tax=Alteraurantiacibacter aestuarii TaxID=650004 RepID=A0A844ZM89_9SPHN|nr:hypothetical protein [Alteraurantiacibacter aestuarii]MXO88170.1 hypothetical protein [Alteraurantiacibacter aestuarii]
MGSPSLYIARETVISAAINAAISAAFFLGVFGFGAAVPVWGIGNYAFDFLPQSFAVALFASLVPALLTKKAILAGKVTSALGHVASTGSLLTRAILLGLIIMVLGAGIWAAILWLSGIQILAPVPAFVLKVLYGGVLGALVTRSRIQAMLG